MNSIIDNAIETAEKVKKDKKISIEIDRKNKINTVIVRNTAQPIEERDMKKLTKKGYTSRDKKIHGIGLNKLEKILKKDNSNDKYSKSLNFLISIGAIQVDSNGKIKDHFTRENYINSKSNLKINKKIDYDDLYQECINPSGDYYEIMPEEELNSIINHVDNNIPKEKTYEVIPRVLLFDYYNEVLRNTILLSNSYLSFKNIGYSDNMALIGAGLYFVDEVKSGGDWDYKNFLGTNTMYYCDMKNYYETYTGESIGNMHYGTVGSYLFSPVVLKSAAGMYQILEGNYEWSWLTTYFDDPRDQANIERGIDLHSSYGFPQVVN